jgi:hypothetical protein
MSATRPTPPWFWGEHKKPGGRWVHLVSGGRPDIVARLLVVVTRGRCGDRRVRQVDPWNLPRRAKRRRAS